MPVNQTSNNPLQADVISRYGLQQKQGKEQIKQQGPQAAREKKDAEEKSSAEEGVKVSVSRRGKKEAANRSERAGNVERGRRTEEAGGNREVESRRAIEAYRNANKATERENNERPERLRERQISRLVG